MTTGRANKILIAGGMCMEMVIRRAAPGRPGETTPEDSFSMHPGGRGIRQALAAAHLGGEVIFLGRAGNDPFGKQMITYLKKENIDIRYIKTDRHRASGISFITVTNGKQELLVTAPGANRGVIPEDVDDLLHVLDEIRVILVVTDIPSPSLEYLAMLGAMKEKIVILDATSSAMLPENILRYVTYLITDLSGVAALAGYRAMDTATAGSAASSLLTKGPAAVFVILQEKGIMLCRKKKTKITHFSPDTPPEMPPGDDLLKGALAAVLAEGGTPEQAVHFAAQVTASGIRHV